MNRKEFDEEEENVQLTTEDIQIFLQLFINHYQQSGGSSPMVATLIELLSKGKQLLNPAYRFEEGSIFTTPRSKWVQSFDSPIIEGSGNEGDLTIRVRANSDAASDYNHFVIPESRIQEVTILSSGEITTLRSGGQIAICGNEEEMFLQDLLEGVSERVSQRLTIPQS